MILSKKAGRRMAILLSASLFSATLFPAEMPRVKAKEITISSSMSLNKKKLTLYVGQKKKLVMENAVKKVSWSVNGQDRKKVILKKPTETTVKLKGVGAGTATVTGTVDGKAYTCSVTVKASAGSPTATPKATKTPKPSATVKPTATPKATKTPKPSATVKPTATPSATKTPKPTATVKPTATPSATKTPKPSTVPPAASATPAVTVPPQASTSPTPTVTVPPTVTKAPPIIIDENTVSIGHASINELSKANGGTPGDQTTREVYIKAWYKNGWNKMVRCNDPAAAELIAMEQACANDNIGYSQDHRNTSFTQAKKKNWVIADIDTPCEADCSSLVRLCVNCGYYAYNGQIPFPNIGDTFYTGNMVSELKKTGLFSVYTASKYLTSSDYLKRGDILVSEGKHTVIVLKDSPTLSQ